MSKQQTLTQFDLFSTDTCKAGGMINTTALPVENKQYKVKTSWHERNLEFQLTVCWDSNTGNASKVFYVKDRHKNIICTAKSIADAINAQNTLIMRKIPDLKALVSRLEEFKSTALGKYLGCERTEKMLSTFNDIHNATY